MHQRLFAFELHDPEHVYSRGNLHGIRLFDAIDLHERRHLLDIGQKQPEHVYVRRDLLNIRQLIKVRVQFGGDLLTHAVDDAKQVFAERRSLDFRRVDSGRMDRGHVDAGCLDSRRMDARSSIAQNLVGLHNRPRAASTPQAAFRGQCI